MFDGLFDGYTRSILIFAGINVIAAYSFFAPFKTGQVSLGQAGFMAVGAYMSAILTQKFGVPFAAALVAGGLVAGLMLGMIEILSSAYIGTTERDFFSFAILILILLYRPTGLFGTRTSDER